MDPEYKRFRSWVALRRSVDQLNEATWTYYDYGPANQAALVMLPGIAGTADVYYKQFLSLCPKGYRLLSVQWPPYQFHSDWVKAFDRFLDSIQLHKIHLLGCDLGGYLSQLFMQFRPNRVLSLVLCNSFCDTQHFADTAPCVSMFPYMPSFLLEKYILQQFPQGERETAIADSIDFMVGQVENLGQPDKASRLMLMCTPGPLRPTDFERVDTSIVTVIDMMDDVAIPEALRSDVTKFYPKARVATMKTGGNFPYLSRAADFNVYLTVHMRQHGVFPDAPTDDALSSTTSTSSSSSPFSE